MIYYIDNDDVSSEEIIKKFLNELKENLKSMSLSFGMKLVNWPPKNLDELLKIKNKEF